MLIIHAHSPLRAPSAPVPCGWLLITACTAHGSRGQVVTVLSAVFRRAWLLLLMFQVRKRCTNSGMATMMPGDA